MRGRASLVGALVMTAVAAAGCGGSSHRAGSATSPAIVLMASAPNSLDPALGDTPQALEADWLVYTPLLTYVHREGPPGTQLVPGLAKTLPSISGGGLTYTFTLISGLKYSNGEPVRASDFTRAVERAIKLWPQAARLITSRIIGAHAFAAGRSSTISGISTDDPTGQITIRLTAPYGAFEDVLALPVMAPIPSETPFTDQDAAPPAGVGPYRIAEVVPGKSFSLLRSSSWASNGVPTVPSGHLDIDVRITGDAAGNARAVLDNDADLFDSADEIPPALVGEVSQQASSRYARRTSGATSLIFLNSSRKPFSSRLAREAVRAALDQSTVAQLDGGVLREGCYVLPPSLFGHPGNPCPEGNPGNGNLSLARSLVRQSGMSGTEVLVSTEPSSPVRQWMSYYSSLLDQLGFRATLRSGAASADSQTGYVGLDQPLPNPVYFYQQLIDDASPGRVDDPYVTSTVQELAGVPGTTVSGVASFWRRLELYVANRAYVAVLGYPTAPEFVSSRIDFRQVVFSPVVGVDWSSLRAK